MTREEFIQVLDKKGYSYKIEGDNIVVTHGGSVWLDSLTSLPPGVEFNNKEDVYLDRLTSLSPDVVFNNGRDVKLNSLIGGHFNKWEGNIRGIDDKSLLNLMISKGMFI